MSLNAELDLTMDQLVQLTQAVLTAVPAPAVGDGELRAAVVALRDKARASFESSGSPGYKLHDLYRIELDAILAPAVQSSAVVDRPESMRCAGCDLINGCPEFCRCTPATQPQADETAWLLETSGGSHTLYWDGSLWIAESPSIRDTLIVGLKTTKDANKAVRFMSQKLAEAALKSFRADWRFAIGGTGVWKAAEHMWPAVASSR